MSSFAIDGSDRERIAVTVRGYERAVSGEYHDDNWLAVVVEVNAGAFSAKYDAAFLTEDFVRFRAQLGVLYATLNGEARFTPLEEQLAIRVSGNGRGGLTVGGEAADRPGSGNKLAFAFSTDQTRLPPVLRDLDAILVAFPVRGA